MDTVEQASNLDARVLKLEARVEALEQQLAALASAGGARRSSSSRSASPDPDSAPWTVPYQAAELTVGETWIEMHEPSARPQLQRLIRDVVAAEGPVTQGLALRRVREAWGLRRAGGRVQDVFDQSVRQLVAAGHLERAGNALIEPGQQLEHVRVPGDDEGSRRPVEEIPDVELELAMLRTLEGGRSLGEDDLGSGVARVFGWTRRGAGIQTALRARMDALLASGRLVREGEKLRAAPPGE